MASNPLQTEKLYILSYSDQAYTKVAGQGLHLTVGFNRRYSPHAHEIRAREPIESLFALERRLPGA